MKFKDSFFFTIMVNASIRTGNFLLESPFSLKVQNRILLDKIHFENQL